jgi:hypothetical protein
MMGKRIACIALLLLVIVAVVVFFSAGHTLAPQSNDTALPTAPPSAAASAVASPAPAQTQAPASTGTVDHGCPAQQDVLDFVEASLSPDSPAKQAVLARLATQKYLEDYAPSSAGPDPGGDEIVRVDREGVNSDPQHTVFSTEQDGNTVCYVTVVPRIQTLRVDSAGAQTIVIDWFMHPVVQYSTWIWSNNQWSVDLRRG